MSTKIVPGEALADSLTGVPGIGVARRRLLESAGITTRDALAQMLPEQLVSLTGMPRSTAETILAVLAPAAASLELPGEVAPSGAKEGDEADALGDEAPQISRLERAALQAQTAIVDASRHVRPDSKLGETLLRFARLADELPRRVSPGTPDGVAKRVTVRLQNITDRLESLTKSNKKEPLSEKRAKRLRQRLKRTRDTIKRTLKSNSDNATPKISAPVSPQVG